MLIDNILLYFVSFFLLWLGAGLVIASIDGFSKKLRISSFAISFFVLGLLTSIPEFAVGISAIAEHNPEIFVGTYLGGAVVIFLFIIPFLATLGVGIRLTHQLTKTTLILSLCVIGAPALMVLDKRVTNLEGFVLIGLYALLFVFIQRKRGVFDSSNEKLMQVNSYSLMDIVKLIVGIAIVFISSQQIVDQTLFFSDVLQVSPFIISLLILSLGTNLPELSLAIRAVRSGKKDIALGDYIGSAAANTLLFGVSTLINKGEVLTANNFLTTFIFIVLGLGLFYTFARSERILSRKEGCILLGIYTLFIFFELIQQ